MSDANTFELSDANFEAEVLEAEQPVLVDFWAEWCGPCRVLGPTIEDLARDYAGKVKIAKLNVDESQEVARKYGIRSIPTVLLFAGGEVKETLVGVRPKQEYASRLDGLLG